MEEEVVDTEYLAELDRMELEACAKRLKPSLARDGGLVRVAKYYPGKPEPAPPAGYRNVLIHTSASGLGGPLSPYVLRNEQGHLLENVWQFSKLYRKVEHQRIELSRHQPSNIIWQHPTEEHVDPVTGEPNAAYWAWREKGMRNKYAVRYPNGFEGRKQCVCSIWHDGKQRLNYIEARKTIYCGEYARLAPLTPAFQKLRTLLEAGENLQLVEVDGPDPTLGYAPYDQISKENPGMLMTEATVRLLVNDARKPFGHGYVIAALLLNGASWME